MAAAHKALTMASTVTCQHKGSVGTSSDAKLKVGGKPVLLGSGIAGKTITGCIVVDDTQTSTMHCKTASVTAGAAAKLKVAGDPVMLDSLAGTTDGTPPPQTLKADAVQAKLRAN